MMVMTVVAAAMTPYHSTTMMNSVVSDCPNRGNCYSSNHLGCTPQNVTHRRAFDDLRPVTSSEDASVCGLYKHERDRQDCDGQ
tara:strand:+ start:26803 stop:27051 length:249 start_codon:yes stop_codon:yes gene_type:complete